MGYSAPVAKSIPRYAVRGLDAHTLAVASKAVNTVSPLLADWGVQLTDVAANILPRLKKGAVETAREQVESLLQARDRQDKC